MILYLLVLAVMTAGASTLVFLGMQSLLRDSKVSVYDARGFHLVAVIFITFLLTSLAFFWGESRFSEDASELSLPIIGVLYTLCCNLIGLAVGSVRLQGFERKD